MKALLGALAGLAIFWFILWSACAFVSGDLLWPVTLFRWHDIVAPIIRALFVIAVGVISIWVMVTGASAAE